MKNPLWDIAASIAVAMLIMLLMTIFLGRLPTF
jgi:hypothetical protein